MIVIQGGPVRRAPTHRIADISFSHLRVACICGEVMVLPAVKDEFPIAANERLATKFREHRSSHGERS